ncbi:MAG TPA: DUF3300 domain-containing protein [Bauldia sp.]|nr:DUF3300 domain-containing protein [Bauldia sp.]
MRTALAALAFAAAAWMPGGAALAQSADQPAPAAAATPAPTFTEAELEQLVAPVALYPDPLLANVLMAATYPLEVVEADRFADANKAMSDVDRAQALDQEPWHSSVKALISTPEVLDMMSRELDWTQKLGEAVLTGQPAVMSAVQTLRAQAAAEKKLESTVQQTVTTQTEDTRVVYVIEPANPDVIYVPWYDPRIVFGPWRWAEWPPFYFAPPPGIVIGPFGWGWGPAWHYRWVVWGGFDWWHAGINMRWTINVNGAETMHVESWHHGLNDTAASFRPDGMAPRMDDTGRAGDMSEVAKPGDFDDDFHPDDGNARRDSGAIMPDAGPDGAGADGAGAGDGDGGGGRRADRFDDGGFGGGGAYGGGWGRDDFGGQGFAWRRPMYRR